MYRSSSKCSCLAIQRSVGPDIEVLKTYCIRMLTIPPAAPIIAPFLIELLEINELEDKHYILWLFDGMFELSEPDSEVPIRTERGRLMLETGIAIAKGLDVYIRLLAHPSHLVRIATGRILFFWYRFPTSEEQKIKAAYREFRDREEHPLVKRKIENWYLPNPFDTKGREFPEPDRK